MLPLPLLPQAVKDPLLSCTCDEAFVGSGSEATIRRRKDPDKEMSHSRGQGVTKRDALKPNPSWLQIFLQLYPSFKSVGRLVGYSSKTHHSFCFLWGSQPKQPQLILMSRNNIPSVPWAIDWAHRGNLLNPPNDQACQNRIILFLIINEKKLWFKCHPLGMRARFP